MTQLIRPDTSFHTPCELSVTYVTRIGNKHCLNQYMEIIEYALFDFRT